MRNLVLLSAFLIPASAPAADPAAPASVQPIPPRAMSPLAPKTDPQTGQPCVRSGVHHAGPIEAPPARNLAELPSGNLELTVYREVGGCHTPVIVRYGIGGLGSEQANRGSPAPLRPRKL